jgi:hypothetical protein
MARSQMDPKLAMRNRNERPETPRIATMITEPMSSWAARREVME